MELAEKRENSGFEIIESAKFGNAEIVLGQRQSDKQCVTWECQNGNNYYWGHYFTTLEDAKIDFHKRCLNLLGENE